MKKSILAILTALVMLIVPFGVCYAEEGAEPSYQTPRLVVEGYSVSSSDIRGGSNFNLKFKLKNTSKSFKLENMELKIDGGDAFSLVNSPDTWFDSGVGANSSKEFTKSFYCNEHAGGGIHYISLSVNYEYKADGVYTAGSADARMSVKVSESDKTASSLTPQLLITDFDFGGENVNGGDNFALDFTVKNNSSDIKIRNVIAKISGGEAFVVADGTDTMAVSSIAPNGSVKLSKNFKCLNSVPFGVYPVSVSLSFEYFDGEKISGMSEATMSIPVVQPDNLQFEEIYLADKTVTVNQENDCGFMIINRGQTRLLNGTAKLLDESENVLASAYIGNIEAGTQFQSNYNLPVTLSETGAKRLFLVFEYENENAEKKSIRQEINVTVEEEFNPYEDLEINNDDEESKKSVAPIIIGVTAGAAVVAVIIILAVRAKKKKARKESELFDEEI